MNQLSKQYGTYEKQNELLVMIKDIDKLFNRYNIKYSLCGGTLLGAIRENGFIPWDDDIDIMVDRKNYNKIISLFKKFENNNKYVLNRNLWIYRIQKKNDKRIGLSASTIDIFVMDNCPDSTFLRRIKVFLVKMLQGMMKEKQLYDKQPLFYRVCLFCTHIIGSIFSDSLKFKWYQSVSQIGNKKKTKYFTSYNDLFKTLKLRYPSSLFNELIMHDFEEISLPVTADYDIYLRTQYGDYMTPPKKEDRIPIHTI